ASAISVVTAGSRCWLCSKAAHASAVLPAAMSARPRSYNSSACFPAGCALAGITATKRTYAITALLEITRAPAYQRFFGKPNSSSSILLPCLGLVPSAGLAAAGLFSPGLVADLASAGLASAGLLSTGLAVDDTGALGGIAAHRAPRTVSVTSRPSCHDAMSSAVPGVPSGPA